MLVKKKCGAVRENEKNGEIGTVYTGNRAELQTILFTVFPGVTKPF